MLETRYHGTVNCSAATAYAFVECHGYDPRCTPRRLPW